MYNLPYYKANNPQDVLAFMHHHPFITLVANGKLHPVATQLPVLIKEVNGILFLRGHIMRNTDHHLALQQNNNALAIFSGAHTYVSASWYTQKQAGSTWNYRAVHASGSLVFTNEEALLQLLTELTQNFENNPASPSLVKDMSKEYLDKMMKAIVSFEMEITNLNHVFKLSQNRDENSFQNIVDNLSKGDASAKEMARVMQENKNNTVE